MIGGKEDGVYNDTHDNEDFKHFGINNDLEEALHVVEPNRAIPRAEAVVEVLLDFVQLLHELLIGT